MTTRGRVWIASVLLAACGPGTAVDPSTSGDESGSSAAQGESSAADTTAGDVGCADADPTACPEGCYAGVALQVVDDACTTTPIDVCLPSGPKPGIPMTTYWALAPSGPVFAEYGSDCSVAARPDAWRECSGAADEPAQCACFCQAGYCPGDEDRQVLDACGLASPCNPVFVAPEGGAVDHTDEHCVLEAFEARTPGVYDIAELGGDTNGVTTRFYVHVGDIVDRIVLVEEDPPSCPTRSGWGRSSRCTLASPEFFASCRQQPLPSGEDCVTVLSSWVDDCSESAPSCG